jgi:glycosyltransferase involved in cell wall biosynthesis
MKIFINQVLTFKVIYLKGGNRFREVYKMRIALLGPILWDSQWGNAHELTKVLCKEKQVTFIEPIEPLKCDSAGLKRKVKNKIFKNLKIVKRKSQLPIGARYIVYSETRHWIDLKAENYDILVTYHTLTGFLAVLYSRLKKKRVLLVYADDLAELYGKTSKIAWFVTKFFFTPLVTMMSDVVVVTAERLKEDIRRYNRNVTIIPNGVNVKEFKIKEENRSGFCVGFVGGFGPWVNFPVILRAAEELKDIDFLLVGGGKQLDYVKERAKLLENVSVTGPMPHNKIPEIINSMDVCLIPFMVDRLTNRVSPVKLFEYWAMKKPVICTPIYEIRRTAGDKVLYINNSKELIDSIKKLRYNKKLRLRMGEEGYKAVKNYDWAELGKRYVEIIEKMVK